MPNLESFIALRHLEDRRTRFLSAITLIAIIGVFLGVTALTSVVAVTGGFQRAFQQRVLGVNSHILVLRYGLDFTDYREVGDKLDDVKGVRGTSPFILHEMIASQGGDTSGILVKGVDPDTMSEVTDLPQYVLHPGALQRMRYDGSDGPDRNPRVLLGKTLAEDLGVEKGDTLRMTSPLKNLDPGQWSPGESSPASRQVVVAGLFRSGFHEYDSRLVITDYRALQDFFNQGDAVNGIDLRLEDPFQADAVRSRISPMLPETDFNIIDWRQMNHNLFTSLKLQRAVLSILFLFIILVASFNIVCTLIMLVLDKKKDIAILKAMGADRLSIMKIFMYEGLLIGGVGTVLGLIGGLGVCLLVKFTDFGLDPSIYMIDHLPVDIRPLEFLVVGVVAMLVSLVATIGPAWWASRLNPVEGLRYEG